MWYLEYMDGHCICQNKDKILSIALGIDKYSRKIEAEKLAEKKWNELKNKNFSRTMSFRKPKLVWREEFEIQ